VELHIQTTNSYLWTILTHEKQRVFSLLNHMQPFTLFPHNVVHSTKLLYNYILSLSLSFFKENLLSPSQRSYAPLYHFRSHPWIRRRRTAGTIPNLPHYPNTGEWLAQDAHRRLCTFGERWAYYHSGHICA